MGFKNQVVVVTGSSSGIGKEIALEFAREGANVVVNSRNEAEAQKTAEEIAAEGGKAVWVVADVTKREQVNRMLQTAVDQFGRIDVLVNNAGGDGGSRWVEDLAEEDWDRIVDLNLKSVFLCSQAVIEIMRKQQYGRIVNISSQAGRAMSIFAGAAYTSAKAGVIGFTRHLARELAQDGISVNAVAPGIIMSGDRFAQRWLANDEEEKKKALEDIPIGRLASSSEVAAAVLFLASENASYFVGACLDVNGGRWML